MAVSLTENVRGHAARHSYFSRLSFVLLSYVTRTLIVCHSHFSRLSLALISYVTRTFHVCHSYFSRMSLVLLTYVIRTFLVCHSYVTRVIRTSLVCHSYVTRMSFVLLSYVNHTTPARRSYYSHMSLILLSHFIRIFNSYIFPIWLILHSQFSRMSLVLQSYLTRAWFASLLIVFNHTHGDSYVSLSSFVLNCFFTFAGGLTAVFFTDVLQCSIMVVGGIIVAIMSKKIWLFFVFSSANCFSFCFP